jgi:predicted permease
MKPPRLISAVLRRLAPARRLDDVLGDLEEAHGRRRRDRGRVLAWLLTTLEGLDMAWALARTRVTLPSALDFTLGVRMLRRYPGLTIVAGLALGFAIAVGAITFEVVTQILRPTLPLAEADRIVGFRLWNAETSQETRPTATDLTTWRTQLRSVEHISAFRSTERNLITDDGRSESIAIAEMSASGFDVARIRPRLGRALQAADEASGAPEVAVIAFDVWRDRFGGALDVIGRTARLGAASFTIVGVMPEHFGFPVAHQAWIPLRIGTPDRERRGDAVGFVFGRLAAGATMSRARAELAVMSARTSRQRTSPQLPGTPAGVTAEVLPFVRAMADLPLSVRLALDSTNLAAALFLVLIASNVALLTFARTVSREAELAMRSALGASRGRIVTQLFAETLVLGLVSAGVGLAIAAVAMRWLFQIVDVALDIDRWPFWIHEGLSPMTVVYAAALAALVALVAGAGPALRVTGTMARWKAGAASGGTARFGGVWTGVIVTQVALTVACLPIVVDVGLDTARLRHFHLGLPADEYLTARLSISDDTPASEEARTEPMAARIRFETTKRAFLQEVAATQGVRSATFGDPPGAYVPLRFIEIDGPALPARSASGHRPQVATVAPGFFEALGARIVAGRDFTPADAREGAMAIVVNESFVRVVLGTGPAVGRRLRLKPQAPPAIGQPTAAAEPWLEIVGVVTDLLLNANPDLRDNAGMYMPTEPAALPINLIVHVPGTTRAMAPALRAAAARVDPSLTVSPISTLGDRVREEAWFHAFWFRLSLGVVGLLLLLSLSGLYAVVSFTVSRRTREIGIRVALGASRPRLLREVLAAPMRRVLLGAALGAAAMALVLVASSGSVALWLAGLIAGSAALVVAVSVLACAVPIRRALRIEPTAALRTAE